MNSRFAFKLIALMLTFLKLLVVAYPFAFALVNLKQGKFKYGYDFFELNYKAAFIIAVGIALVFATWNAFEFAKYKKVGLTQYLKSKQKYAIDLPNGLSVEKAKSKVESWASSNKRVTKMMESPEVLKFSRRSKVFIRDVMTVRFKDQNIEIESRPKFAIWFIDLARNYKNVQWVAKAINS
jgi:hypothetical protein